MPLGRPARALLALACLTAACSGHPEGHTDPTRTRLLAALPDDALSRGVYMFEGDLGEDISPGSLVAPILGPLISKADLVVETGAPPVTLLSGLEPGVVLPDRMILVDGVAALGGEEDLGTVEEGLDSEAQLAEPLAILAATEEPVGWAGPLPSCQAGTSSDIEDGAFVVTLSGSSAELTVTGPRAEELEHVVDQRLATEGPANSPGKPWPTILADHEVNLDDGRLVIEAVPADLPGGLLRLLLDTRGFSFLRPADC